MVKGWNSNRGWNNGWGPNRKNRNGSGDLIWVNHTEIVTGRRAQNEPIAERDEKIVGPVPATTGEEPMTGGTSPVQAAAIAERGNQTLPQTPESNKRGFPEKGNPLC